MKLNKLFSSFLAAAMAFSLVACNNTNTQDNPSGEAGDPGSAGSSEKVINVATQDPQVPLDMQLNTYSIIMRITDNISESLIVTTADGDLEPVLLTALPSLSDDKLTYSFELKEGVQFHNGATVTSEDVKYSYERLIKSAKMASLLEKVVGYEAFFNGEADSLEGFTIIDDTHFEITLAEIYTPFTSAISTPYCAIYPADACEEAGDDWGLTVLYGTGPFMLESYNTGAGCEIVKFEDYHGTKANIDRVSYKFIEDPNTQVMEYQKGTIDVLLLDSALYPTYANGDLANDMYEFQPVGGIFFLYNIETIPDVRVREAISLAVDRNAICESILYGTAKPASSFLPSGLIGHDESLDAYEYNPERARELLAEAGYEDGYDLRLSVNNRYTVQINVATAIQAQAAEAGIRVQVDQVDSAAWTDMKLNGKVDCGIGSWYVDYNDPDSMLYPISDGRTDLSSSFWHNDEFRQLMIDGVQTEDRAVRQEIYEKAEHIATREDFAAAPIYNESMFYLVRSNISGFKIASNYRFFFVDADIAE